jgi:hypothetical protein
VALQVFTPVAYYDKHMDCIRVVTVDRSATEVRIDGFITVCKANHRSDVDAEYVGFVLKGVRHLFATVGIEQTGVYRLVEIIDRIVKYKPGSAMAEILGLVYGKFDNVDELKLDLSAA